MTDWHSGPRTVGRMHCIQTAQHTIKRSTFAEALIQIKHLSSFYFKPHDHDQKVNRLAVFSPLNERLLIGPQANASLSNAAFLRVALSLQAVERIYSLETIISIREICFRSSTLASVCRKQPKYLMKTSRRTFVLRAQSLAEPNLEAQTQRV